MQQNSGRGAAEEAEAGAEAKVMLLDSGLPQPRPANLGSLTLDDFLGYKVWDWRHPSEALQAALKVRGGFPLPWSEASLPELLFQAGDTSWSCGN